jgi:hypothetical protein
VNIMINLWFHKRWRIKLAERGLLHGVCSLSLTMRFVALCNVISILLVRYVKTCFCLHQTDVSTAERWEIVRKAFGMFVKKLAGLTVVSALHESCFL